MFYDDDFDYDFDDEYWHEEPDPDYDWDGGFPDSYEDDGWCDEDDGGGCDYDFETFDEFVWRINHTKYSSWKPTKPKPKPIPVETMEKSLVITTWKERITPANFFKGKCKIRLKCASDEKVRWSFVCNERNVLECKLYKVNTPDKFDLFCITDNDINHLMTKPAQGELFSEAVIDCMSLANYSDTEVSVRVENESKTKYGLIKIKVTTP